MLVGGYEVSQTWLILHCVDTKFDYLPNLTFYRWDAISRVLMVVNSSINFLIYCMGSQQFKVRTKGREVAANSIFGLSQIVVCE